jgi:hypothetical protein
MSNAKKKNTLLFHLADVGSANQSLIFFCLASVSRRLIDTVMSILRDIGEIKVISSISHPKLLSVIFWWCYDGLFI